MAANNPANMEQFLELGLGIENAGMIERIQAAGYTTINGVLRKPLDFADKVCNVVRKGTGGNAANKDISVPVQEEMKFSMLIFKYQYMVRRPEDFDLVIDPENREDMGAWCTQNKAASDSLVDNVLTYTSGINVQKWFESMESYLTIKVGPSGMPLLYIIRTVVAGAAGAQFGGGAALFHVRDGLARYAAVAGVTGLHQLG